MPELPDITVYIEALESRVGGQRFERIDIATPFLLRSIAPKPAEFEGRTVTRIERVGKRIAVGVDGDLWAVLHLMIAGRLHWHPAGSKPPGKNAIATFGFSSGTVSLTEAGSRKRASLTLVAGQRALHELDPGGIDVFAAGLPAFTAALTASNHTLKRALTDPRTFSGIGNAYSDEILHAAQLSPIAMTQKLKAPELERLYTATRATLTEWVDRLRLDAAGAFPEKVTAFRNDMAVHGKFGEPCPRCGSPVQRIRYADNETNYCPTCQTGGRVLADRGLSRLLGSDWPRTLDELESLRRGSP